MNKFLNLKIHVENNLDEIVMELEKRGLSQAYCAEESHTCVCTYDAYFNCYSTDINQFGGEPTTLAELKEM